MGEPIITCSRDVHSGTQSSNEGQSLAIPGVHIAPPGTRDRMPMRWAGGCVVVGWRAEPSMAIPVVHIAPPGTNAVDARGMARWLSGGGLMVVCPKLDTHTCTWNSMLVEC